MPTSRKVSFILMLSVLFMVCACSSIRADLFLLKQTTPQQKANMLFEEGIRRYNADLKKNNDLKAIPEIRRYFTDALKLDPSHPDAKKYISELDTFKTKLFDTNLKTATTLAAIEKRSAKQDYELIYAVKQASDLSGSNPELAKLKTETKDLRPAVIQARVDQITVLEPKILAETNQTALLKLLGEANRILAELRNIDPENKTAADSKKNIDAYVTGFAQKDIDSAREKLTAKKYSEAETAILRAEKSQTALGNAPNPQIKEIKYSLYYSWGNALFVSKKYQSAADKTALALKVNRTSEALALKAKIEKEASVRDYDAEIADILESVDNFLAQEDPVNANNVIETNLTKLKNQTNKTNLSAKSALVETLIKKIYQDGIALYNEEDYEDAVLKFGIVIKYKADYEQAQAYMDRSTTKIRALSGKN